jgi:hypothetical protein
MSNRLSRSSPRRLSVVALGGSLILPVVVVSEDGPQTSPMRQPCASWRSC